MNNFADFITSDIDAKKLFISTMPTKTKTNKKKYNENIESILMKYNDYRDSVRNYLIAKSRSFNVTIKEKNIDKLNEQITSLEHVKFLLNPSNTYFEKMGFDDLIYQINNYYVFNFNSLDKIINEFLDKFELADIHIDGDDFDYTCYVHKYMTSFLEVRNKKTDGYDKVSEIFEQIYWINPEIIEHIELNFRKLIRKHAHKFTNYISKLQRVAMEKNNVKSYSDCINQLDDLYLKVNLHNKENVKDIIELALKGDIDITQYLPDSKIRINAYDSLVSEDVNRDDKESMEKIYSALEKLHININEFDNYIEFQPLIDDFKVEYSKLIPDPTKKPEKDKKEVNGLKTIEEKIENAEKELEKLNRRIFGFKIGFIELKAESSSKHLKIESVRKAKELYTLYKEYDKEYFKDKVLSILTSTLTISDLLHLYYSFDYFKKLAIQKVYNITDYNEIVKYSDNFDLFEMDSTNIIVDGMPIFEESNIPRIIANKYRLSSIKVTEDDLHPENLEALDNKISLVLRISKIEESETDVNKIWFMVNVAKIINKEQKEAQEKEIHN